MKTVYITIIIISLLASVGITIITRTTSSVPQTTEVVVLRDVTEKNLLEPNPDEILGLFDLTNNAYSGAHFRFANISNVSYNVEQQVKIEATGKWLSNELDRQKEIEDFQNGVKKILADAKSDSIGRSHSSVYLPIARELIRLSQSKSGRCILIIYSDLMENTADISFYDKKTFNLLQSNSQILKNIFEKEEPLPSLEGIGVYFIFQPTTEENDTAYRVVSEFYKTLLEDKGAKVSIRTNL